MTPPNTERRRHYRLALFTRSERCYFDMISSADRRKQFCRRSRSGCVAPVIYRQQHARTMVPLSFARRAHCLRHEPPIAAHAMPPCRRPWLNQSPSKVEDARRQPAFLTKRCEENMKRGGRKRAMLFDSAEWLSLACPFIRTCQQRRCRLSPFVGYGKEAAGAMLSPPCRRKPPFSRPALVTEFDARRRQRVRQRRCRRQKRRFFLRAVCAIFVRFSDAGGSSQLCGCKNRLLPSIFSPPLSF